MLNYLIIKLTLLVHFKNIELINLRFICCKPKSFLQLNKNSKDPLPKEQSTNSDCISTRLATQRYFDYASMCWLGSGLSESYCSNFEWSDRSFFSY